MNKGAIQRDDIKEKKKTNNEVEKGLKPTGKWKSAAKESVIKDRNKRRKNKKKKKEEQ